MRILLYFDAFYRFAGKGFKCLFLNRCISLAVAGFMIGVYTDLATVSFAADTKNTLLQILLHWVVFLVFRLGNIKD